MKNYILFLLVVSTIVFTSCKKKSEQEELRSKKEKIVSEISEKNAELDAINKKLEKYYVKTDIIEPIIPHTVSYEPFQHTISLQSSVSTDQEVMIFPEYAGTLTWSVKEGQHVGAGQVIGRINDGGLSSQLQQVKIQADLAKTAFEKQQRLWNEKIGSEIQYLQAKTAYESAQKSIAMMQSQIGRTQVKAPFSGTIDQLIIQSGQSVAPGLPLGKIVNKTNLKVTADISENYLRNVKVGTPVLIELLGIDQVLTSKVSRIGSSINPSNRSFQIEIPVSNTLGLIKPNMTAKLKLIDYRNQNAIVVPNNSLQTNANGQKFVYAVTAINGRKGKAEKRLITIGQSNEEFTEVVSGLKVGDILIKEGSKTISEGSVLTF